jgi:glycerol-3-phosphate acyltransferase PlsY
VSGALPAVVVAVALGYLSGSLAWGLWLTRGPRGVDIRTVGSRNIGATNVYRVFGPALGVPVLLLDALKGAVPVLVVPGLAVCAAFPGGRAWCALAVAAAAVAGHVWTCFAGFKGGKGVATAAGVLIALAPLAFGVSAAVFVLAVTITRFISVGSMLGALAFPIAYALLGGGVAQPPFLLGVLIALVVVFTHRENLARLARGEERRFSLRRGGAR